MLHCHMGSRVCSCSAAFHSVVVFRRIHGKRTARPGPNGEQVQAVVSGWQWLAPKRRGEAVL
jgi:hypothetical protein